MSCRISPSLNDLLHWVWPSPAPNMLLQTALLHSFFMAEWYSTVYILGTAFGVSVSLCGGGTTTLGGPLSFCTVNSILQAWTFKTPWKSPPESPTSPLPCKHLQAAPKWPHSVLPAPSCLGPASTQTGGPHSEISHTCGAPSKHHHTYTHRRLLLQQPSLHYHQCTPPSSVIGSSQDSKEEPSPIPLSFLKE